MWIEGTCTGAASRVWDRVGTTPRRVSQLMHTCDACHRTARANPAQAISLGWRIDTTENPATTPCVRATRDYLLFDDGTVEVIWP